MMQIWFITIIYLVYTGLVLITQEFGVKVPILLNMREYLFTHRKIFIFVMFLGYLLTILNCFIPTIPGPMVLGDLFVTIALLYSSIWYNINLFKSKGDIIIEQTRRKFNLRMAIIIFNIALLHFLLPHWVLL
ncbi:MAG: hypothetical protein PQJ49_13170 [Sphaerochaetaceae bacterium]|nr:hypothetical protein [Sphaerochaetaceae bacterium]MDC7250860.1 hypothetical protein [Sphaerochaetaceae bacterium]